jgi:hypothetical protein
MPAAAKRRRLTKAIVEKLQPGEMVWDSEVPSFAVRRLRNSTSFLLKYRNPSGAQRWYTIGQFGPLTVEAARRAAFGLRGDVAKQEDPQAMKAAKRSAFGSSSGTLRTMVELFVNTARKRRTNEPLRTMAEYKRTLMRDVVPKLGDRQIRAITSDDLRQLLEKKAEVAPVQARQTYMKLRSFFRWALKNRMIDVSPMADMDPVGRMPERDRVPIGRGVATHPACHRGAGVAVCTSPYGAAAHPAAAQRGGRHAVA